MKTINKITGLALVLFFAGSMALNGQLGLGRGNMSGFYCPYIPDLTEDQDKAINELYEKHWSQMAELNREMLGVNDLDKQNEITKKFQDLRYSHRKAVLSLLTKDQKNAVVQNNNFYGPGRGIGWANRAGRGMSYGIGRGMGPCGGGLAYGRGRGRGMGAGAGYYGTGRGLGRGMGPGLGWRY
jgi:hypothetical protein